MFDVSSFLTSFWIVAVSEIGDKTQLLSIWLGLRYQRPGLVLGAIFFATLANHALAAWLGALLGQWLAALHPSVLPALVALLFAACGAWALRADSFSPPSGADLKASAARVFALVAGLFFLAEMGDKTQVATTALAAKIANPGLVTTATSLGLVAVNIPAVLAGKRLEPLIGRPVFRWLAAASFFAVAAAILVGLLT